MITRGTRGWSQLYDCNENKTIGKLYDPQAAP